MLQGSARQAPDKKKGNHYKAFGSQKSSWINQRNNDHTVAFGFG